MEEWRDIKGYEGIYQVSSEGRIKSLDYLHTGKEKILCPKKHNKGYLQIQFVRNGTNKTYTIHRLVAETFIENPYNYPCVNHIDENKQNNKAENLEWCTARQNTIKFLQNHPNFAKDRNYAKSKRRKQNRAIEQIFNGVVVKKWENVREIELRNKWSAWSISECCRGNRKKAYGYTWRYAD